MWRNKGEAMQHNDNPVLEALFKRRSIRKFTEDPVSDAELTVIAEALRWAPSGRNLQPCRVLFLRKGDARKQAVAALSRHTRILDGAAVVAVVALDRNSAYDPIKDCQVAGAGLQNMLLAVHALGLGAVWTGDTVAVGPDVLAAAGLPVDSLQYMAMVAIGRPAEEGRPDRKPLADYLLEPLGDA